MPTKSEKQRRAMYAAAEGKSKIGIPQAVGREFIGAPRKSSHPKQQTLAEQMRSHLTPKGKLRRAD